MIRGTSMLVVEKTLVFLWQNVRVLQNCYVFAILVQAVRVIGSNLTSCGAKLDLPMDVINLSLL